MSQRERWIVYPLLFFAFTLAMRDQWPTTTEVPEFDVVSCRHLIIRDAQGRPAVDLSAQNGGPQDGSGVIVVYGSAPQIGNAKLPAVRLFAGDQQGSEESSFGTISTYGTLGSPSTTLTSDRAGGAIKTFDAVGKQQLVLRLPPRRPSAVPPEKDLDPRNAPPRPPIPSEESDSANGAGTPPAQATAN